jgi:TM2 domain-containing membrane protein YozV
MVFVLAKSPFGVICISGDYCSDFFLDKIYILLKRLLKILPIIYSIFKIPKTMNQNLMMIIANLEPEEALFIQNLIKELDEEQQKQFLMMYQNKRRETILILITTIMGFVGFAGIQRFLTDRIGMGILYFFTGGLCMIGTIVDLVNYRSLAFEYNQKVAYETLGIIKNWRI